MIFDLPAAILAPFNINGVNIIVENQPDCGVIAKFFGAVDTDRQSFLCLG